MPRAKKPKLSANRSVKGKNLRAGDYFEGEKIVEARRTSGGNVSIKLESGDWRRRPAEERFKIQRET